MPSHFSSAVKIAWLQFLDRVKPRYGVGGRKSPRITTATPAEAKRIREILERHRG